MVSSYGLSSSFADSPICNPKDTNRSLIAICKGVKILNFSMYTFPAHLHTVPSCFSSHTVNKWPFAVYLVPHFPNLCAFCWWYCYVKWPLNIVLKWWLVLLSMRRLRCAFQRKYMLDKLCSLLLAVDPMLINQQHISSKVSLNKTHKNQLTKMWARTHKNLTLYFSKEKMIQYALIQWSQGLYTT